MFAWVLTLQQTYCLPRQFHHNSHSTDTTTKASNPSRAKRASYEENNTEEQKCMSLPTIIAPIIKKNCLVNTSYVCNRMKTDIYVGVFRNYAVSVSENVLYKAVRSSTVLFLCLKASH